MFSSGDTGGYRALGVMRHVELVPVRVHLRTDRAPVVQALCELGEVPEVLEWLQSPSSHRNLPTNRADDDDNSRNNSPTLKLGC